MSKRVTLWLLLALLAWIRPGLAWATPLQAEPAASRSEVISLAENPQLESFQTRRQPDVLGFGGLTIGPRFWQLSIPVPGLSQFLMGDPTRGAFFFFAPLAMIWMCYFAWQNTTRVSELHYIGSQQYPSPGGEFATLSPGGVGGGGGLLLLFYVLPLLPILALWTWNIADAQLMNQQLLASPDENPDARIRQERLLALLRVAEENQLRPAGAGIGLNHRLMDF